jgi:hypothetical protein
MGYNARKGFRVGMVSFSKGGRHARRAVARGKASSSSATVNDVIRLVKDHVCTGKDPFTAETIPYRGGRPGAA